MLVFPNKTQPNIVSWAAGVPFSPRIRPGFTRRMSMDLETLNSRSASLREARCGQYPLGRVVIGRHLVSEGRKNYGLNISQC